MPWEDMPTFKNQRRHSMADRSKAANKKRAQLWRYHIDNRPFQDQETLRMITF